MKDRTVRDFQCGFDVAPYAEAWANANHFSLRSVEPDGTRRYQRGSGLLTGAMLATVRQQGPNVHLETWIRGTIPPINIMVESGHPLGNILAAVPRKICREAVNKLLAQLGQPPIA
jgi:hypothetical protein